MLSVVMPAYNEAEIIEATVREWYDEVIRRVSGAELIVVNDCSTDRTGDALNLLARELPALRVFTPERNGGHGKALRHGFDVAKGDWVFQTDSDRQLMAADFWKLWEVRDGTDFVMGVRSTRADGPLRLFITGVMQMANFGLWGIWLRDANCPFKLMRKDALQAVLEKVPRDSFIPMVMVSVLARKLGYRVAEVEVQHLARQGGHQSLRGLGRWVRVGSLCLWQLAKWRVFASRGVETRASGPKTEGG
jgi:glycosyltransferase involved in cell wall biosynthesis